MLTPAAAMTALAALAACAVLLLEARCHGRSSDAAFSSLPRFAEDIAAGLAWLRRQAGVDAQRVALLGHSVGAAAALLHAARVDDVCGVVSLAAFAHPREVMCRLLAERRVPYPVLGWWVLRHVQRVIGARFDDMAPITSLLSLRCPVLLVHGREDRTVPFADALRLQQASAQRPCESPAATTLLAVTGDHDLRAALASHATEVVAFLQACASRPSRTGMPAAADNAASCSP
jgi:dipeptidyl aminopeptidase/acylaminoacyl peptidase